ncbi:tetratricopeptide repeat protein [Streptomyces sp. VRA16 Mangrove soil]|uniref:tetratricopeptide repeat protein n=1 Tax=Streptomyces sp. VRA16 Mangrove soil TaxID=2817434 RepID=UPI001A9FF191|nr:tetratricopeptide repeat protein [Streptomyces sp. VRA16 Mangrove soil]MBO1334234.1 tetratricopeptide repeat protein [Streptomyces sp. VRA16 Mangrove soil]
MTSSPYLSDASAPQPPRPNLAFRELRGRRSPGEFAAAVRRAAREIGERVSCDARYIGRVEAGEIRCPNYAYERVFLHMFPGRTLADLGFAPRSLVRGRGARALVPDRHDPSLHDEESDVRRRAFMTGMTGSTATVAVAALAPFGVPAPQAPPDRHPAHTGVGAVEEAIRRIRLLDDRHGGDSLYRRAAAPLRTAFELLDSGSAGRDITDRLQTGAGELAISVGWLAHDSGRFDDARSHYAEALATARMAGDEALEAHAFCNTAFLARDAGRPREAVRAAQAAARVAAHLGSPRLLSLLALREAGGWAGLGDQRGCERSLARAQTLFARGSSDADPEWMSFYGEAELEGLESQCWSALGAWDRAARHAGRAVALQDPHFTRNMALYTAELADDLARSGHPDEAAAAGTRALGLLRDVRSSRIEGMLATTSRVLLPHRRAAGVNAFLEAHSASRK